MWKKCWQIFYEHINVLFYYDRFIMKHYATFYYHCSLNITTNVIKQYGRIKIAKPFWHVKLPNFIVMLALWMHFTYFYNPDVISRPFWAGICVYPAKYRQVFAIMMALWIILCYLQYSFGLSSRLIDYQFLWLLHLDQIKPESHYFQQSQWNRLKKFNKYAIKYSNSMISSIHSFSMGTITYQIFDERTFDVSLGWTIFWGGNFYLLSLWVCAGNVYLMIIIIEYFNYLIYIYSHLSFCIIRIYGSILSILKSGNNSRKNE